MVTRERILDALSPVAKHIVGYGGIALIVAGVWGLAGWQWGLITAGTPFAAFYLLGQFNDARQPGDPD